MNELQQDRTLDVIGLRCPLPMLKAKKVLANMVQGSVLTVLTTDPSAPEDFAAFCQQTGHQLLSQDRLPEGVCQLKVQHR